MSIHRGMKIMTIVYSILLLLLVSSCAQREIYKEYDRDEWRGSNFYQLDKKEKVSKIKVRLMQLENELLGLQGRRQNAEGRHHQNSSMSSGNDQLDLHRFNAQTDALEMHQIDQRISVLKMEIFGLRSELNSLQ